MKQLIFSIVFMAITFGVKAQDMTAVFTSMPDEYVPQLQKEWRKDLADLYASGKEARLQNTMNGFSVLKKLTTDYLLLKPTEQSTLELKLLPLVNNTYIVCLINTINGPVPDSRVSFFTTEWQPLVASDLFTPATQEEFIRDDTDRNSEAFKIVIASLDIELIEYTLNPENRTLTATYTTPLYIGKKEREKIIPFLNESPKVYQWEKFHFN